MLEKAAGEGSSPKDGSGLKRGPSADLFASDEFRLYCFKVLPCSKRFVHDWPSCPFAHPGEKAKRRDPRTHQYDCEMCPAVVKGEACELGAACPHSHHVFESWLHPQKYRTLLCKDGDQCHREVCFFAHGSKQLRTPERSQQQQRMCNQQQRCVPLAGPEPASKRQQQQQQVGLVNGAARHAGPTAQQQQAANGVTDSSRGACAAGQQSPVQLLPGQGFACTGLSDPNMALLAAQQQTQLLNGAYAHSPDGSGPLPTLGAGGAVGGSGDVMQLLQNLAAEVSVSRREAAEHSRVAAAAQQKLQLLEQLMGCGMGAAGNTAAANGSACGGTVSAGPTVGPSPRASPMAGSWAAAPAGLQHLPYAAGPHAAQLLAMQQFAAQGAYDGAFPRRHSLDEVLLRRARNSQGAAGRPSSLWHASPSAALTSLAAVTEGVPYGLASGAAAAADMQALAAALAASARVDGFGSMQAAAGGLMPGSSLLDPCAGSSGLMGGLQAPEGGAQLWSPQDSAWTGRVGLPGAFNSASQLPCLAPTAPALTGQYCLSAPQAQSDYLLQLHAALQDGGSALASLGAGPVPRPPVRASFDTSAAYLPHMPAGLAAAAPAGRDAASVAGCDDAAGVSGSSIPRSSGASNAQDGPSVAAVPDKLATNPIGGAGQLGWF